MGEVYLAEDTRLGRQVALKRPSEDWLSMPDARERLHREASAAGRLNHPNIAAIYDVLDVDSQPYIVMEYVEGESLARVLRRGALPLDNAIAVGTEIAEALAAAHAKGIVHRDSEAGEHLAHARRACEGAGLRAGQGTGDEGDHAHRRASTRSRFPVR